MLNAQTIEPLEEDELDFLKKKFEKESKDYLFAMNLLLVASVCIPLIVGLYYLIRFEDTKLMLKSFLIALMITVGLFIIVLYFLYMRNLSDLKKDLAAATKTVERPTITSKKYMPQNRTYHFYLTSSVKYSIEVSGADFQLFEVDDEINIEYATYSKEYFGYF